jgi:hypothetical protein
VPAIADAGTTSIPTPTTATQDAGRVTLDIHPPISWGHSTLDGKERALRHVFQTGRRKVTDRHPQDDNAMKH